MSIATTPNNLTDEQDAICRDFYELVVTNESLWTGRTKTQGIVGGAVLNQLGYTVSAGQIVPIGTVLKFGYGQSPVADEFIGLYDKDAAIVRGALDAADEDSDPVEADPSESPESDEVGDVLQQDV